MPKCIENQVYDLDRQKDPRVADWELDTARNCGLAPYPHPSMQIDYIESKYVEGVEVGVDVYWMDGSVSHMPEAPSVMPTDTDVGYHNLTLEDL